MIVKNPLWPVSARLRGRSGKYMLIAGQVNRLDDDDRLVLKNSL